MREHPHPAVLSVGLVVAGPVVGVKAVLGVGIDDDLGAGLVRDVQRIAHGRNRLAERIAASVQAEHRRAQVGDLLDWPERALCLNGVVARGGRGQAAVPGRTGAEVGEGLAGQPGDLAAPAEAGDRQAIADHILARLQIAQRRAHVAQHLGVGRRHHNLHHRAHVGQRCGVAGADEEGWGDRHITQLGQPPADVADVLVHPEHFRDHDHRWEGRASRGLRPCQIGRDLAVGGLDHHRLNAQPHLVGHDRIGLGREGRGGVAGEKQTRQPAPREMEVLGLGAFRAGEVDHDRLRLRNARHPASGGLGLSKRFGSTTFDEPRALRGARSG